MPPIVNDVAATAILILALTCAATAQSPDQTGDPFARADSNADGVLSRAEFINAAANRFSNADADADGYLSKEELLTRARARDGGSDAVARIDRMIARFDSDRDNRLSASELPSPRREPGWIFDRIDRNSDGVVTRAEAEEAAAGARQRFGRRGE
ncbi:MAG: EF-hand domain-containing protein [Pseudomonadota bacterium]